jgi:cardiolipin synthase A/B
MSAVHIVLWSALGLIVVGVLVAVYVTESVNAEARRQDDVVSVSPILTHTEEFLRALGAVTGRPLVAGNDVRIYQNGDEIFPPMLDAIGSARDSVHFATYVYDAGEIPDRFASAFADAARRGVEVRVVLDRNGAKEIPPALVSRMRDAGCDVRWFRRAQWYDWEKYNRRTHRRLFIVDGQIGFTGGVGISDLWTGKGDAPTHWRDTHAQIRGPAVGALQDTFVDTWNEATGQLPLGSRYFPALDSAGKTRVSIVQSNPANATSTAQRTIAALVAGARKSLLITNAYFVPTPPFVQALRAARARGVDVKVVMPGPYHNKPTVRRASRHTWGDLVRGGVELYEHQLTMVHAKTVVADGLLSMVGSINFDPRSFALNAECAAVIADDAVARRLADAFAVDLAHSRRVTLDDLDGRSVIDRLKDAAAYWVRGQL